MKIRLLARVSLVLFGLYVMFALTSFYFCGDDRALVSLPGVTKMEMRE